MKPRSIRARLTVMNALILVAVFAVTGAATWFALRDSVDDTADDELRMRVQTIWVDVADDLGDGSPAALKARLGNAAPSLPGVPFRIATGGRWVWMSPGSERWGEAVPQAGVVANEDPGRTSTVGEHPMRLLAAQFSKDGRSWIVEAGMPMTEFYEAVRELAWLIILGSPVALLVAAAAGHWMSGRALAPVATIASTARSIGADNLSRRLPLRGADDELEQLSQTLNETFARLEQSFRRITQFTADASHELRTPVAIIRTAAEVARERSRTEAEYAATLSLIVRESERMSLLIDDLLLLAREDAGAPGAASEPLDLAEVVRDACEEGRHLAAAAGVNFVADIPRTCSSIGDAEALRRLFIVLLDNAVKYTQRGGTITVHMDVDDAAATISVHDTGVGVRPWDREQIFERFYRVDSDRGRKSGGVGLGLSIARAIATRHGGSITVGGGAHGGSVFRVTLPIAAAAEPADSPNLQSDVVA
jgi:heavy metal sensor kinase